VVNREKKELSRRRSVRGRQHWEEKGGGLDSLRSGGLGRIWLLLGRLRVQSAGKAERPKKREGFLQSSSTCRKKKKEKKLRSAKVLGGMKKGEDVWGFFGVGFWIANREECDNVGEGGTKT